MCRCRLKNVVKVRVAHVSNARDAADSTVRKRYRLTEMMNCEERPPDKRDTSWAGGRKVFGQMARLQRTTHHARVPIANRRVIHSQRGGCALIVFAIPGRLRCKYISKNDMTSPVPVLVRSESIGIVVPVSVTERGVSRRE
jgi:hypothetical protein